MDWTQSLLAGSSKTWATKLGSTGVQTPLEPPWSSVKCFHKKSNIIRHFLQSFNIHILVSLCFWSFSFPALRKQQMALCVLKMYLSFYLIPGPGKQLFSVVNCRCSWYIVRRSVLSVSVIFVTVLCFLHWARIHLILTTRSPCCDLCLKNVVVKWPNPRHFWCVTVDQRGMITGPCLEMALHLHISVI